MEQEELFTAIQNIFRELFNDEQLEIQAKTSQADIPKWDSLNHAILIDRIEKHFEIKFDLMDMLDIRTVGDISEKILAKKNA